MKDFLSSIKEFLKDEYKFLLFLILLYIILQTPVNYYIVTGGGTDDVSSRISVDNGNKHKGSFNISFVTELKGSVITYLISYIIPTWERDPVSNYQYTKKESIEDVEFRSDLDLLSANSNATYWAYTLANKEVEETSSKLYIIGVSENVKTPIKVGDEILSIDGYTYDNVKDFKEYIQTKTEDSTLVIKVLRKNKEKEIKVKPYKEDDQLLIGIVVENLKTYKTKPTVSINFKSSESGPSGGLITTLEIYNQLVKKDITKGLKIAGTGTIEYDGTIGEIGGIEHKLLGAESSKTDIFLAPAGKNYKDAVKYKKEKKLKIKIIKVKTIKDAINKLEKLK